MDELEEKAADCKSAYPGSIPGVASSNHKQNNALPAHQANQAQTTQAQKRARSKSTRSQVVHNWVYFARCGEFIKIGTAANPESRLQSFRVGCPYPIELVGKMPASPDVEAKLHARMRPLHHRGEWFQASPVFDKLIRECCESPRRKAIVEEWISGSPCPACCGRLRTIENSIRYNGAGEPIGTDSFRHCKTCDRAFGTMPPDEVSSPCSAG